MKDMWAIRFSLTGPSAVKADAVMDGATVNIQKNSRELDVTDVVTDRQEHAIAAGRCLANMFLNKLSWGYGRHLELAYPIRVAHTLPSGQEDVKDLEPPIVYSASVEIQILDSSGNTVADSTEVGRIGVGRSEAASYYRRAMLSFDPFDRFRNLYLAAENISSLVGLARKLGKLKEQQLLEAALQECFQGREDALAEAARVVPAFHPGKPLIPEVATVLYRANRCQLNHSKALRNKKVPFEPRDEEEVQSVLPLVEFVALSLLKYEEGSLQ